METLPLNEDNFTLEDIYDILQAADSSDKFRLIPTGPVYYYHWEIEEDIVVTHGDDLVEVKAGSYDLVANAQYNFITLIKNKEH